MKKIILKFISKFFLPNNFKNSPSNLGKFFLLFIPKFSVKFEEFNVIPDLSNWFWVTRSIKGYHEPSLYKFLKLALRSGNTAIDVGAHVGLTAIPISKIVGKNGKVFLFEPFKQNLKSLYRVIKYNNCKNIKVIDKSVNSVEKFFYEVQSVKTGLTQLKFINSELKYENSSFQYNKSIKLDNFLTSEKISNLHFIKIDVDGPDFEVLIGTKNIIKKFKPSISIEISQGWKNFDRNFNDLLFFSEENDYKIFYSGRASNSIIEFKKNHFNDFEIKSFGLKKGDAKNIFLVQKGNTDLINQIKEI